MSYATSSFRRAVRMSRSTGRAALGVASLLACSPTVFADVGETFRENEYSFVFGDASFADAATHIRVTYGISDAAPGETRPFGFTTPTTAQNPTVTVSDGLVISNLVIAVPSITMDVTTPSGAGGTRRYEFDVPALGTGPNCFVEEFDGHPTLRWTSNAGGGLTGIPYQYTFSIPGDWSASGTQPGQHELLNVNPAWTIDQDFVYDARLDVTRLVIHQDPYVGAPALSLRIHGWPVTTNPADLNGDGHVDGADLAVLLGNWGTAGAGDIDGDGVVSGADLAILLGAWN